MFSFKLSPVVVAGVLVALLVAEVTLRLAGPWMPEPSIWPTVESEIKSEQVRKLGGEIQLVLVGSSITEAAVDPEILEEQLDLVTYNSAMPFMSPSSYEVWLEDLVLGVSAPEVVVIGLRGWAAHSSDDRMAEGLVNALEPPIGDRWFGWSRLVTLRGLLSDWDQSEARRRLIASGKVNERGHQVGYYDKEAGAFELPEGSTGASTMEPSERSALKRLIDRLKNADVKVMLLIEPGRPSTSDSFDSGSARYRDSLLQDAAEWDVPVWNAYSFTRDPKLFADSLHFNRAGTEDFSHELAEKIGSIIES